MDEPDGLLILSIRPRFAHGIFEGSKTVELRRTRPVRAGDDSEALIYASSPEMRLVGTCRVKRVHEATPASIWRDFGSRTGVTKREFDEYFAGAGRAIALELERARPLNTPVALHDLRARWDDFQPPQSFRYIRRTIARRVPAVAMLLAG